MISNSTLNNQYYILRDSLELLIEYVRQNFEKIKSSLKKENKYEFLEKINGNLQKISKVLWQNHELFNEEITCFSQVEHYIIYIISKNCEDENFGHVNCTIYLLNIFKELIDAKFEYLYDEKQFACYEKILKLYPHELHNFRMYFNEHIFIENDEYDEKINELNRILRE